MASSPSRLLDSPLRSPVLSSDSSQEYPVNPNENNNFHRNFGGESRSEASSKSRPPNLRSQEYPNENNNFHRNFGGEESNLSSYEFGCPSKSSSRKFACEEPSQPVDHPNFNRHITDLLEQVLLNHQCAGKREEWNALGIKKAITSLRSCTWKITSGKDAIKLPGVGPRTAEKIDEILSSGTLRQLGHSDQSRDAVLRQFKLIYGAGPSTIKTWYERGHRTYADLVRDPTLTTYQRIGLEYAVKEISRKEVEQHFCKVVSVAKTLKGSKGQPLIQDCILAGSYRRGKEMCGDIDVLCVASDPEPSGYLEELVLRLIQNEIVTDKLEFHLVPPQELYEISSSNEDDTPTFRAKKRQKVLPKSSTKKNWRTTFDIFHGVSRIGSGIHRRIDIIVVPPSSVAAATLFLTGSQFFNRSMRLLAKNRGFYLTNSYISHIKNGTPIPCNTERDIFDLLQLPFREPYERNI